MRAFWTLASMIRLHPRLLAGTVVFALLAAFSLSAGLASIGPVVQNVLAKDPAQAQTLRTMGRTLDSKLGGVIPDAWIEQLSEDRYTTVLWAMIAIGAVSVLGGAFQFLNAYFTLELVSKTVLDLRLRIIRHTMLLPLLRVTGEGPKLLLQQSGNDTAQFSLGLSSILSKAFAQVLRGIAALLVAVWSDWRLAGVALLVALPLMWIIQGFGRRIKRAANRWLRTHSELMSGLGEVMDHLRVVKTNGAEERCLADFRAQATAMVRHEMKARTTRAISSPLVESISVLLICAMCVVAAKYILAGALEPKDFVVTLIALGMAADALRPVTQLSMDIAPAASAAERIVGLLREPTEIASDAGKPALARHASSVRFENVTFTYPGQEAPALRGLSLEVRHGETIALVGPNGCGKTTVLSLLPRLIAPQGGRVLIDGVDIAGVSLGSLRDQIGVVTQESVLFKGTIRGNIGFGVDHASEEQIIAAARRARAEEFILAKPGKYDEGVGEGGAGLSGGQRQRLCIARAIVRDPAILILDEATSMIDSESEAKIAEALGEFARGRTCLVVAHRLSTVRHADRIVVMDRGGIADIGTHDELLERCALYRSLAEHQLLRPAGV